MFKITNTVIQGGNSSGIILHERQKKLLSDPTSWFNIFYTQVTSKIDEGIFAPLYCPDNGRPNVSIRVLVAMMVLKEGEGISDRKLFEKSLLDLGTRRALGLINDSDNLPVSSVYYSFRSLVMEHEKAGHANLFDLAFENITKSQCLDFNVNGKRIRMDSKLLGSNIAWLSRYELIHKTVDLFYNSVKKSDQLDEATCSKLDELLKLEGGKVVYTCSTQEVKSRLSQLGVLISKILPLFNSTDSKYYDTLKRVFKEQFKLLSPYELICETIQTFYNDVKKGDRLDLETRTKLEELLDTGSNVVVSTCSPDVVKSMLNQFRLLISSVLYLYSSADSPHYDTLAIVFKNHLKDAKMGEKLVVVPLNKENIDPKSIQSPHDTDCTYRNKDGNKVKGFSINITESCDDGGGLNLIGSVNVQNVSTSDVDFFQDAVDAVQDVFPEKTDNVHADGAYNSPANQEYCKKNSLDLHLHAIQGARGRYQLELLSDGNLSVFDTETSLKVESVIITTKNNESKWRIMTEKGYRYFRQQDIDTYQIRKKIDETPTEVLQKRNNVEASIFQLAYHYPNKKSRYRGTIKHQMWANMRTLWVNFVRIVKFMGKSTKLAPFFAFIFLFKKTGGYHNAIKNSSWNIQAKIIQACIENNLTKN